MWDPSLLPPSLSDVTLATPSLSLHSHKALLIPHLPSLAALLCPACPPHEPVTIILADPDRDHTSNIGLTDALNILYTTGNASPLALEMGLQESPERNDHHGVEEVFKETFKEEEVQNQNETGKECKNCNLTFVLESSLRKHTKSCLLGTSPRWECSVCAERFQFRRMLTSHRKNEHTEKPTPKLKSKLECEISISNFKSEESVGDFLFVEGSINQSGHEVELKEYVDETFDNPNVEERGIDDSPDEERTTEEEELEIADSKGAGIVESGKEESKVGRPKEKLTDVTTLLENWRTKMLNG